MTTLANAINERIRDLAGPLQHVETEFDFASSDPAQLLHAIRLFVTEAQTRSISDVSLGTNNILFLALLLQELESREAAKEVATSILAIEEPEAHLHPQLQRQIFRNFLRREHSVIVTTHSPSIASVAPLASIVLLRRVGSTKAFTTAGLKLTPEQVNDLQRYLDVTRAEILFARGIILVEGAAEQFLIPAFATKYLKEQGKGTSLDDYGIAVCSVNGTDFRPYHRLLSKDGLCVPHVIVTDADPRVMNDKIVIVGLRRGIQLIGEEGLRTELTQLITDGKSEQVVSDLRNEGIFVGDASLELDLVDEFANEMESTYSDLNTSEPARLRFKTAVEGARKGEQAESDEMMLRIERIGKGRFAQRLAEKVGAKQAPAYIKGAIEKIVSLVEENNA